jgi:hypothetical protein
MVGKKQKVIEQYAKYHRCYNKEYGNVLSQYNF